MRTSQLMRLADRYGGIPLIFTLGMLRRKRQRPQFKSPHIAILYTAAIGDTVMASAIIHDLIAHFPFSPITFFTGPSNYQAARLINPKIEVIKLSINPLQDIKRIRERHYDLWLDLGPWPRLNALYSYACRSDLTVGFQTRGQGRHWVYDIAVPHSIKKHEVDNFRRILHAIEVPTHHLPRIDVTTCNLTPPRIVAHLFGGGSRSHLKEWPISHWTSLINQLTKEEYKIALTGSSSDRLRCESLKKQCLFPEKIENLAGLNSLEQTACLLKSAKAVISVDTGVMHMAVALGSPTIALHGPTTPKRCGGLGGNVIAITPNIDYSPCIKLGFEKLCNQNHCMKKIGVNQVYDALTRLMKKT